MAAVDERRRRRTARRRYRRARRRPADDWRPRRPPDRAAARQSSTARAAAGGPAVEDPPEPGLRAGPGRRDRPVGAGTGVPGERPRPDHRVERPAPTGGGPSRLDGRGCCGVPGCATGRGPRTGGAHGRRGALFGGLRPDGGLAVAQSRRSGRTPAGGRGPAAFRSPRRPAPRRAAAVPAPPGRRTRRADPRRRGLRRQERRRRSARLDGRSEGSAGRDRRPVRVSRESWWPLPLHARLDPGERPLRLVEDLPGAAPLGGSRRRRAHVGHLGGGGPGPAR